MRAGDQERWKIGVLFSMSGLMAIPSLQHVRGIELAVDELNRGGGVLGRPLEPLFYDAQCDPACYRDYADRLLTVEGVSAIVGCCTSLTRRAVLPSIERRNGLLWYPDLYEGFEYSPNVIYVGAATNQNSLPLARHLFERGARRFLLIGSDYIYPREVNRVMRDLVEREGGEILEELYVPIEPSDVELERLLGRVRVLEPDVVFSTLVGTTICRFLERYADAGIDPHRTPIASHNVTEAELAAVGRSACAGHITAGPYFSSLDTIENRRFVAAFRERFGADAPISQYAVSGYAAVRLFAAALELAGAMDTQRMAECARGLDLQAPQGRIVIDDDNNHTWLTPRIGVWNGHDAFDIVWDAGQPVRPDPWLVSYGGVEELAAS